MAQNNKSLPEEYAMCRLPAKSLAQPGCPMFKFTVRALCLTCLLLAGYVVYGASAVFTATAKPPAPVISDGTMAAALEAGRQMYEEMATIDPLTGKTKMQTLTEESDLRAKEAAEEARIANENLLAAKARLKAWNGKLDALEAEKEKILNKYR
jgi:hypothetical protein